LKYSGLKTKPARKASGGLGHNSFSSATLDQ
jgi:hypothetical protein